MSAAVLFESVRGPGVDRSDASSRSAPIKPAAHKPEFCEGQTRLAPRRHFAAHEPLVNEARSGGARLDGSASLAAATDGLHRTQVQTALAFTIAVTFETVPRKDGLDVEVKHRRVRLGHRAVPDGQRRSDPCEAARGNRKKAMEGPLAAGTTHGVSLSEVCFLLGTFLNIFATILAKR